MATKLIELELGDTIKSITQLKNELKVLKKEFENAAVGSDQFTKSQQGVKQLEAEIKQLTNTTKANVNALGGINQSAKFADGSYGKLKQQIKETKDGLLKLTVGTKEFDDEQKKLISLEKERIAVEEKIPSLFQTRIKGAIQEVNTLKDLRDAIKETTDAVIRGEEGAAARLAELKDKLDDVTDATKTFKGSGVEQLNTSIGLLTESITNLDPEKLKIAFDGIGAAMKAIPVFLLVEGIKLLIDNFDEVLKFANSFTDTAKEVKRLEQSYRNLSLALNNVRNELNKSIAIQEASIALANAQNKSNSELQAMEQRLYETKIKSIEVDLLQSKASKQLNEAKLKDVDSNNSLYESYLNVGKSINEYLGLTSTAEILDKAISINKKERNKENVDAIAEDTKKISELETNLATLQINRETDVTVNKKEQARIRRELNREIEQNQINLIQNQYKRDLAQIEFDKKTSIEDIKLRKISLSDKNNLIKEANEKSKQDTIAIAKDEAIRLEQIANNHDQFIINLIRNDYERQVEQNKLNEKIAIEDAENTIKNIEELEQRKLDIKAQYAEEQRKLDVDFVNRDLQAQAEYAVLKATNYDDQFQARLDQLETQKQIELENINLTESERLDLIEKYNKQEIALQQEKVMHKQMIADAEINYAKTTANILVGLTQLFTNDQKELSTLAKVSALITIAANEATAISGLVATSFSPTQPDNLINPLAPYLKIAAGMATIITNAVQAKQIINSFEQGGYTGNGNPKEVSTNLGQKSYTYHKDEYVIPSRVLNTPKGSMIAMHAESLRKGTTNPYPYIGGMFDGGFASRSASFATNQEVSNTQTLQNIIASLPTPVVRVSEINKVNNYVDKGINISSL